MVCVGAEQICPTFHDHNPEGRCFGVVNLLRHYFDVQPGSRQGYSRAGPAGLRSAEHLLQHLGARHRWTRRPAVCRSLDSLGPAGTPWVPLDTA